MSANTIFSSISDVKRFAKNLYPKCKEAGMEMPYQAFLNTISRTLGEKNFQSLTHHLPEGVVRRKKKDAPSVQVPHPLFMVGDSRSILLRLSDFATEVSDHSRKEFLANINLLRLVLDPLVEIRDQTNDGVLSPSIILHHLSFDKVVELQNDLRISNLSRLGLEHYLTSLGGYVHGAKPQRQPNDVTNTHIERMNGLVPVLMQLPETVDEGYTEQCTEAEKRAAELTEQDVQCWYEVETHDGAKRYHHASDGSLNVYNQLTWMSVKTVTLNDLDHKAALGLIRDMLNSSISRFSNKAVDDLIGLVTTSLPLIYKYAERIEMPVDVYMIARLLTASGTKELLRSDLSRNEKEKLTRYTEVIETGASSKDSLIEYYSKCSNLLLNSLVSA